MVNGTKETYGYDLRHRLTSVLVQDSGLNTLANWGYTWDAASQVTATTESGVSKSYTYDSIGQVLSESWNTGYSASYTYDSNGNRATRNVNGFLETYSYDAGDKLTSIVSPAGTTTYGYDNAGNTTSIASPAGTKTFTWNEDGRLGSQVTSAGTSNFGYTGLGARASSSGAIGAATYLRDGVSVVSPVLKDGTSTFTPGTSLRTGATSTYSHSGLKNAMSQTASAGTVSATKGYDAFGNAVSSTGTWQGPFAYAGSFGYQTDSSGYKLLGHRYYDPDTGRFLSRDPIAAGRNWYAYGGGNGQPINTADPHGLDLTIVGNTEGLERWDWWASFFGSGETLDHPTKDEAIEAIINEPAGSHVTIWGHGTSGGVKFEDDYLDADDVRRIAAERKRRGKGKLGSVSLRSCDTCRDGDWINAWLEITDDVNGYVTGTLDGPMRSWTERVTEDPEPLYYPWAVPSKDKKKKKKKGGGDLW